MAGLVIEIEVPDRDLGVEAGAIAGMRGARCDAAQL